MTGIGVGRIRDATTLPRQLTSCLLCVDLLLIDFSSAEVEGFGSGGGDDAVEANQSSLHLLDVSQAAAAAAAVAAAAEPLRISGISEL